MEHDMNSITTPRRVTALGLTALAAVALPLAVAAPAQASTTRDGCTITPLAPEFRGTFTAANVPYVYYPYEVSCIGSATGLSVEVETQTWEADLVGRAGDVDADGVNSPDEDRIGSASSTRGFGAGGGSTVVDVRGVLPHTDTDFDEEVYHSVRFRVTSGPVTGGWTTREMTQATTVGW
jgi:hypothetical protein